LKLALHEMADKSGVGRFSPSLSPENAPATPWKRHAAPLPARAEFKSVLLTDSGGALDHFYEALWRSEKREPGANPAGTHYRGW